MKKRKLHRRRFLQATAQAAAFTIITPPGLRSENRAETFALEEMTVVQLQDAMKTGQPMRSPLPQSSTVSGRRESCVARYMVFRS
jgi:hypothetical protein